MPTSLGPAEILVILVVALIVLGPKRLPEAGRQIGKALAEIRHWSSAVQEEIKEALDDSEPQPPPLAAAPPASPPPTPVPSAPVPAPPHPAPSPPVERTTEELPPEWTAPPRSADG